MRIKFDLCLLFRLKIVDIGLSVLTNSTIENYCIVNYYRFHELLPYRGGNICVPP